VTEHSTCSMPRRLAAAIEAHEGYALYRHMLISCRFANCQEAEGRHSQSHAFIDDMFEDPSLSGDGLTLHC